MTKIEPIEFKIKFITPLLIHGADSRVADTIGLTGKALRGCWRFWFRALVGGTVQGVRKEDLLKLEGRVFGSSDETFGAKFRLLIGINNVPDTKNIKLGFQRNDRRKGMIDVKSEGFPEGSEFAIKILPRKNMTDDELKVLLVSVWLWGNLGGIGQRARRGFGSPVIHIDNNSVSEYFTTLGLPIKQSFETDTELKDHLKQGIKAVWDKISEWCQNNNIQNLNLPVYDSGSIPPSNPSFFMLSSLKQITVADNGFGEKTEEVLNKVHGTSACPDLGTAIPQRKASPVFTRLHKVKDVYYPVITWSTPRTNGCARQYIYSDCKCRQYLDGRTPV